jgi:hypothetical protein
VGPSLRETRGMPAPAQQLVTSKEGSFHRFFIVKMGGFWCIVSENWWFHYEKGWFHHGKW